MSLAHFSHDQQFSGEAPSFYIDDVIPPEQIEFVAAYAKAGGYIDYEDVIGHDYYKEVASTWEPKERAFAQASLGDFAGFMIGVIGEQIGHTLPSENYDYSNPKDFRHLIMKWRTVQRDLLTDFGEQGRIPEFSYMNIDNGHLGEGPISKWLMYGTSVPTDPRLDEQLRLYVNPVPEATSLVAMGVSAMFGDQFGRLPWSKFREDSSAGGPSIRNDRLLFWLHSPEELTVTLRALDLITNQHPEAFEGREPILLGQPIIIGDRELPTVRLAQESSDKMRKAAGGNVSFNQVRCGFLGGIAQRLHTLGRGDSPTINQEIINAVQEAAPLADINQDNIAFNASQDLSVIEDAILAAA